jgi:hypothetical protein
MLDRITAFEKNEFENEIDIINEIIYGHGLDEEDEPWSIMSACDMEENVEATFDVIESACAGEEWSELGMVPKVVSISNQTGRSPGSIGNGGRNARGKEETGNCIIDDYEVGKVARMMKDIATSLKQHEKDDVLQTPFDARLDDLAGRIAPWREEFAEEGRVLRSRT